MRTYAALLRGVNVGKNQLAMADLRALLADLGCEQVRTYLQSGNAVFGVAASGAAPLAQAIEDGLAGLGVSTKVLLRTGDELAGVLAGNPFLAGEPDPAALHVTFLAGAPDAGRAGRLQAPDGESAAFRIAGREVYLHCPDGYGRTKLTNSFFESRLAVVATTRNWRTVTALAGLTAGGPG